MCARPRRPRLKSDCNQSAIREYDAKLLLAYWLERAPAVDPSAQVVTKLVYPSPKVAQISWDPATNAITPDTQLPSWVFTTKLVAKPDQLIKRRGKAGLLALNKTWEEAKEWIQQRAGKPQKVSASCLAPPIASIFLALPCEIDCAPRCVCQSSVPCTSHLLLPARPHASRRVQARAGREVA